MLESFGKGFCFEILYVYESRSVVPESLRPRGLQPTRLLLENLLLENPWDSPDKNTGMDCHFPLQGIFPTQESNPGLLHCRQMIYRLSYEGSPLNLWSIQQLWVVNVRLALQYCNQSIWLTCCVWRKSRKYGVNPSFSIYNGHYFSQESHTH